MVQHFIEPFDIDVIKVTIKDKPGLNTEFGEKGFLKKTFEALRQYTRQEKRIRELRTAINERQLKRRLRYCFRTWCKHVATMRELSANARKESKMSNDKKIEMFISAIAEKQKKIAVSNENTVCQKRPKESKSASMTASVEDETKKQKRALNSSDTGKLKSDSGAPARHRLEAQKLIIKDQKAKLAEQSKFIEDMKLKEIDKATKQMHKQTIDVAKQAFNQCDQRTRRSLIHLMREEGFRDKSVIDISQIPRTPTFLIRMEARAEARKERMKQADVIRQRKQEELKRQEEIRRKESEEKQRLQQIEALKESQKIRREQEERRRKIIEKNKRLEALADQFYKKYLFRRYALYPLSEIVEQHYKRLNKADQHYAETLLIKIFSVWKNEWIEQQQVKLQLADKLYRHNLLWYCFDDWKRFALDMKQKYQVATDFYEMKLEGKYFKIWYTSYSRAKALMQQKEAKAIKQYEKSLKIIYFNTWMRYMSISDDIKEREQRRDEWRDLIKKFIPVAPKLKTSIDS